VYDPQQHRTHNGGTNAGEGLLYSSLPLRHPLAHPQLHKLKGKNVKMKRKITRVLAALFAMVMLVSCMSLSAFAAGDDEILGGGDGNFTDEGTTTPATQPTADNGHVYELYQIIKGDVASVSYALSNPVWGKNAVATPGSDVPDETITAITNLTKTYPNYATDPADAAGMASELKKYVNFNESGSTTYTPYNTGDDGFLWQPILADDGTSLEFTGIDSGYYLVKDNDNSTGASTLYIFKITQGTLLFTPKGDQPTVEKKVTSDPTVIDTDAANAQDTSAVAMGDTVYFVINGKVSSYLKAYNQYFYQFTDTLTSGFDVDVNDVKVYINDTDHDVTKYFYKSISSDGTTLTVAIQDLLALELLPATTFDKTTGEGVDAVTTPGTAISLDGNSVVIVTYKAKLNKDANVSSNLTLGTGVCDNPNSNTVSVKFYNNPNVSGEGKTTTTPTPDPVTPTPDPDIPKDDSEPDTVYVYTTAIKITKEDEDAEPLSGAQFTLTAADGQIVNFSQNNAFVQITDKNSADAEGKTVYYQVKLSDEITSYTTVDPTTIDATNAAKYEKEKSEDANADPVYVKYYKTEGAVGSTKLTDAVTNENGEVTQAAVLSVTGTVDGSGVLTFSGLGPGTYTLTESKAPTGYSTMAAKTFTISYDQNGYEVTDTLGNVSKVPFKITVSGDSTATVKYEKTDGMFHWTIVDTAASTLPSTGGIGTTIFYVVGSALVLGAIVLLITKKRMNNEVG
jgi:LPXTG-motif cell wall-anchored protein